MARMPAFTRLMTPLLAMSSSAVMAQTDATSASGTMPVATSLLKLGRRLGVVIIMFFAFVWIMKRMSGLTPRGGENMKVSGGLSLGQRERLVIVEVDNQRLLLGVTAQSIQLIRELSNKDSFDQTMKQVMPESSS